MQKDKTMPAKQNPLKLNKLQLRTLALAQVLAGEESAVLHGDSGAITLAALPDTSGPKTRVGPFVLPSKDASGFTNPAVWAALQRKGLVMDAGATITLSAAGIHYCTGFGDQLKVEGKAKACGCC